MQTFCGCQKHLRKISSLISTFNLTPNIGSGVRRSLSLRRHHNNNNTRCSVTGGSITRTSAFHWGEAGSHPRYEHPVVLQYIRKFSQQSNSKESGSKDRLIWLVYFSGFLGGVMLIAVLRREYHRYLKRQRGIDELKIPSFGHRLYICKYKDTVLFDSAAHNIEAIEKFAVREDDIWLVGWPRSGSTWTQEIVYLVQTDLDLTSANSSILDDRFPYLEFVYPGIDVISKNPSPRFIKSHLPFHLLPSDIHLKKPKIIYICRNPKDVIVSYFHFIRMLLPFRFKGKFPEFFTLFMNDQLPYSPWSKHVKDFWEHKDDENILFLKYEDAKEDLPGTVRKIANFLGKSLTENQVTTICEHCSFNRMKVNSNVNHTWFEQLGLRRQGEADFMRKGIIGDWKNYLTADMSRQVDKLVEQKLGDVGLEFVTEEISENEQDQ